MEGLSPQAAATAIVNIGFAGVVGALFARHWLASARDIDIMSMRWRTCAQERLATTTVAALILCLCGLLLSLWSAAADMADVDWAAAGPAFVLTLRATHYGHTGLFALGVTLLMLPIALANRRAVRVQASSEAGRPAIFLLVLLFAAARTAIGHAHEAGLLSIAVELLHLLLIAFWAGAVFASGWLVLPAILLEAGAADSDASRYLDILSRWATFALAGILASGFYNAARVAGSPRHWFVGDYGMVLALKIGIVLTAALLGGVNRFWGLAAAAHGSARTRADRRRGLRFVVTVLRLESMCLLLALLAAAILTSSAPPNA